MSKKYIDYTNWSKDELIKELKRIKETTYGLVWHRDVPQEKIDVIINSDAHTPEELFANEVAGRPFPVLKEVKNKEVFSKKEDQTHILIEGDNYHSLAVLNFTHQEAIDVIYIDPPYNTGSDDFIYTDKFKSDFVLKEDPFRHSKWLSFMEKRLKLARKLLKDEGVIFISIDDNEQAPLKMLCDDIFGEKNFISTIIWEKKYRPQNDAKQFSTNHDFILCYSKKPLEDGGWQRNLLPRTTKMDSGYKNPDNDPRGLWTSSGLMIEGVTKNGVYEIIGPTGKKFLPSKGKRWSLGKQNFEESLKDGRIWFGKNGSAAPRVKRFLSEVKQGLVPSTIWKFDEVGHTGQGVKDLEKLDMKDAFSNPKPVSLIKHIVKIGGNKSCTVLDFFAGSGTTGHGILELNEQDGGNRKFILCTNNENDIATKVCQPRLKKAIQGIKGKGLGGNLKYFTAYDFVESEPSDKNKHKLVNKCTEMLCIKEGIYDSVFENEDYKILKNNENRYLGIIFYEDAIDEYKKTIKKIDAQINTYVFSLGDDPNTAQFADVANKVVLQAIPEIILKVYQQIFR